MPARVATQIMTANVIAWFCTVTIGLSMISRSEVTDWALFVGCIGASIFSWGMGNYHRLRQLQRSEEFEDRRLRREQDREDRTMVLEDIRGQIRVLVEMESRQKLLQQELEAITVKLDETKCRLPDDIGDSQCGAHQ